jgi:plastocyanin
MEQQCTSCPRLTRRPPESRIRQRWAALIPVTAAILLCAAAPAVDWSSAQRVDVVMNDYRFVPDRLTFQRGTAYRIHFVNEGKELHEFTAPAFFAATTMRDRRMLTNDGTEVVVPAGGSIDIDLIPERIGRYELICADHDWAGMVGEISVR